MADYVAAFETYEPKSMAALYDEKAFVIWGDRLWRGREEIQTFYEEIFDQVLPPDTEFDPNEYEVIERDIAYIVWSGKSPTQKSSFGVDTFVVRKGRIQSLTVYIGKSV